MQPADGRSTAAKKRAARLHAGVPGRAAARLAALAAARGPGGPGLPNLNLGQAGPVAAAGQQGSSAAGLSLSAIRAHRAHPVCPQGAGSSTRRAGRGRAGPSVAARCPSIPQGDAALRGRQGAAARHRYRHCSWCGPWPWREGPKATYAARCTCCPGRAAATPRVLQCRQLNGAAYGRLRPAWPARTMRAGRGTPPPPLSRTLPARLPPPGLAWPPPSGRKCSEGSGVAVISHRVRAPRGVAHGRLAGKCRSACYMQPNGLIWDGSPY